MVLLSSLLILAISDVAYEFDNRYHLDESSCTMHVDVDYDGNDIKPVTSRLADSAADCCTLCDAHSDCSVWTYEGTAKKVCWLKTSANGVRKFSGYTSGCTTGTACPGSPPPPSPSPGPGPPPSPIVRGGGSCSTALDCSLGGECRASKCVCDAQYTGSHCAVLRLRRAKLHNDLGVNESAPHPEFHWGGHAIQDPSTKKWVGFFSYMAEYCDLNTWQSQSMIISAVSDAPDGPFDQERKPVIGPWSHNAMISQHPNGSFFLFHIGTGKPKGPHSCAGGAIDPVFPFPAGHPEPPQAYTHVADDLQGPWRAAPGVPNVNNPAVYFWDNGTTAIYDRNSIYVASSIDVPYGGGNWTKRTYVSTEGKMIPEDPFVWRDNKDRFHMLINANSGHHNCGPKIPCGGHLWSEDGLTWSKPYWPAFGTIVPFIDGTNETFDYVERPQIALSPTNTPLVFYFSHGYSHVENIAMMFCQDGDKDEDCVTTVE